MASPNHINHAPIANVFTVITSIYYVSKNTIVCKKKKKERKSQKKFLGTSRLLSLPYVVILFYYAFIIPFVFYTYISVNRITYVN